MRIFIARITQYLLNRTLISINTCCMNEISFAKIICIRYCCGFPFMCVTLTLLGTPGTFLSQHTHILVPSSPTEKGSYSFSIQVHKSGVFLSRLYFQQPLKKLSKDPVPGVTLCELPNQQLIPMLAKWEYQLSIKGKRNLEVDYQVFPTYPLQSLKNQLELR